MERSPNRPEVVMEKRQLIDIGHLPWRYYLFCTRFGHLGDRYHLSDRFSSQVYPCAHINFIDIGEAYMQRSSHIADARMEIDEDKDQNRYRSKDKEADDNIFTLIHED
jgi:hypothetical protein